MEHTKQIEVKFVFILTYNNPFPEDFILIKNNDLPVLAINENHKDFKSVLKELWSKHIKYNFEFFEKKISFRDVLIEGNKCVNIVSVEIPFSIDVYKNSDCYTINEIKERDSELYGRYRQYFDRTFGKYVMFD